MTKRIADLLAGLARGEEQPLLLSPADSSTRNALADRLRTLRSFTALACDQLPGSAMSRRGDPVVRRCYYRAINASETRYYTFWLTADGRVADFASTLD